MKPAYPEDALVYVDGAVVRAGEARVSVFDRGFLYGDSIYEVTRTVSGKVLFWQEHLERLGRSGRGIEMELPERAEIDRAVAESLAALGEDRAYLRLIVTRGAGVLDLHPSAADHPRLLVIVKKLTLPAQTLYREGARLAVVGHRRNAPGHVPASVKSGNYLSSVLAIAEARRRGAYEALLAGDGDPKDPSRGVSISEGASSNFFVVRGGAVWTPPDEVGLLAGITRDRVLALLTDKGVPVVREAIYTGDLAQVEEAFLTSSVRGVMPVVQVDEQRIGEGTPGPLTRQILVWYGELIGEACQLGS